MVREGRVFISPTAGKPQYGVGYYVTAYEVGAQVTAASSGTTATVAAGHGFATDDKLIVGTDATAYLTVDSVTDTTIVLTEALSLAEGDLLVNLAQDTGTTTPNYDGAGLTVYTDMDYQNAAITNTVLTDSYGRYRYYHRSISRWELVRSAAGPIAVYTDTGDATQTLYDVRAFGATGDGVTDDSQALQSALDAVGSGGGKVYIPAGTYIVSTALWIKSYTHVYGDGIDVTTVKRKANSIFTGATTDLAWYRNPVMTTGSAVDTPYTNANPGASITVSDLTLDGDNTNQTTTTGHHDSHLFNVSQTHQVDEGGCIDGLTLQRVKASNGLQDGITVRNSRNVLIDSCITYMTGQVGAVASKNGISVYGASTETANGWNTGVIVSNNHVSYSGDSVTRAAGNPSSEGIVLQGQNHFKITGNDISYVDYGIEFTNSTAHGAYTTKNGLIANNTIHDLKNTLTASQIGIAFSPGPTTTHVGLTISGNVIENVEHNAMAISYTTGLAVIGNTIRNTNTSALGFTTRAVDVVACSDVVFTGNTVVFASPAASIDGVVLLGVLNGSVTNNVIDGPTRYGISLISYSGVQDTQNILVANNRVLGGTYAFALTANGGVTSGNSVLGNYASGFSISELYDNSGETNYNYGGVSAGALTVPGLFTQNDTATDKMRIRTSYVRFGDATDRRTQLGFAVGTAVTDGLEAQIVFVGDSVGNPLFEFTRPYRQVTPNLAFWTRNRKEELITLNTGSVTTDSSPAFLPADSVIEAVCYRITTAITTAATISIGDDSPQTTRFVNAAAVGTAAGVALSFLDSTGATGPLNVTAKKVRITTNVNPGAGAVRVTVFYKTFTAPTS